MRIHHLNCGCMCPLGGALFDGFSRGPFAELVCHCLLIESDRHGLILVDTGLGINDMRYPERRLSGFFRLLNNIRYSEQMSALAQIQLLGFQAEDVRHIILTHLDFDHAGGISDFPAARIHLLQRELDTVRNGREQSWLARQRFRPQQWTAHDGWRGYASEGERWFGFDAVRAIDDLSDEILLSESSTACHRKSCWCRCRGIPPDTQAWRSATAVAGCCTGGTPGFIAERCITPSATVRRACVPISG